MSQIAVVTGAGSGVGRAVALALLERGWDVALVGRREAALRETAGLAGAVGERALVAACDIGEQAAVQAMAESVLGRFGPVDALVNSAGTNTPRRSLAQLSDEDYHRLMDTNLNGAYYCVQAFLPAMRQRGAGTIVNISSIAGLRASPKAGVAYVMSKFGMTGLTQAINLEERPNGIRACSIFPGDINTPILDLRPNPPPADARVNMIQPEDVARCVLLAIELPPRAVIEELTIQPQ
jgi:NAD(P)-dependent dehydrogenase (short-subunit alcohol dehydrogenase family)